MTTTCGPHGQPIFRVGVGCAAVDLDHATPGALDVDASRAAAELLFGLGHGFLQLGVLRAPRRARHQHQAERRVFGPHRFSQRILEHGVVGDQEVGAGELVGRARVVTLLVGLHPVVVEGVGALGAGGLDRRRISDGAKHGDGRHDRASEQTTHFVIPW